MNFDNKKKISVFRYMDAHLKDFFFFLLFKCAEFLSVGNLPDLSTKIFLIYIDVISKLSVAQKNFTQ